MKTCTICGKGLDPQQVKYCSVSCKSKGHYQKKTNSNTTYSQFRRYDLRKKELIYSMGGGCSVCGYNKNYAALDFHHLRDKSFNLDARRIGNSSFEALKAEAAKCILLCANCHREEHSPHCLLLSPSEST